MGNEQNVPNVFSGRRTVQRKSVQITECNPDEVEDCYVTLLTNEEPSANDRDICLRVLEISSYWYCSHSDCVWGKVVQFVLRRSGWRRTNSQYSSCIQVWRWKLVYLFQRAKLPAFIGDTKCNIETKVFKSDNNIFLSKSSFKKNDLASMLISQWI